MLTTWNASDKACQLREKQATELENANRIEQQHLKRVTNKKMRDCVRKEEELECKRCEDEQHCGCAKRALVFPAQPPEEATMQVDQPSPGINSFLSDMMKGITANKEGGKNIDPKTRSPPKNKQRNNAPTLKPSMATTAAPEKSIHTKLDKHDYKYPCAVVEASIKLSNTNPFQEFVITLQNLVKNGQLVDHLFVFSPIKTGGAAKKIHEPSGIPINMT
jgi:hypothetical protein